MTEPILQKRHLKPGFSCAGPECQSPYSSINLDDSKDDSPKEEIPYSMVPMISRAKKLNVKTPVMEATVTLAESLLQTDSRKNARTLESVGLSDMDIQEILNYLETGSKI